MARPRPMQAKLNLTVPLKGCLSTTKSCRLACFIFFRFLRQLHGRQAGSESGSPHPSPLPGGEGIRRERSKSGVNLAPALAKLLGFFFKPAADLLDRDHARRLHRVVVAGFSRANSRTSCEIFIEQNFGPHIEQKCATLAFSFGSVSSW